jgi:FkbM family methyltransferase
MARGFLKKISNLCEILTLPGGLLAKLTEPSYSRTDLAVCHRLRLAGIQPGTLVDVGANVGQFAFAAATTWPGVPIYSFEPVPDAYARLQDLARRCPAIHPANRALGSTPGRAEIRVTNQTQSSSLLPLHHHHRELYPDIREATRIDVEVSTLEKESAALQGPPPFFLKLDVQGFESAVLSGAGPFLDRCRWILLETSTRPMYEGEVVFPELCRQLSGHGFSFVSPLHIHFSASGAIGQFDAIFVKS